MTKKPLLILAFVLVTAALVPLFGIQWTQDSAVVDTSSLALLAGAQTNPPPTCSRMPSGLPHISWFNAGKAEAGVFDCVDCLNAFEQCYRDCKIEPDTPGEVLCQENCVITVAECLGSCGA